MERTLGRRQVIEWLLFAAAVLFNVGLLFCLWVDASEWFHEQQHETLLDELWDEGEAA